MEAGPTGSRSRGRPLSFGVCGFVEKTEIPLGDAAWLTVVSPDQPDGIKLLLEPDGHPATRAFKQALVEDGIPFTGRDFTREPLEMDGVTTAVFDDTCGNLIQIASVD